MKFSTIAFPLFMLPLTEAFSSTCSFAARSGPGFQSNSKLIKSTQAQRSSASKSTTLTMIDSNVLLGGGIAIGSFAVGIGLVAFTENQGERAKARGSGLSDSMSTQIAGMLMEDVEVSSVSDLNSLTSQLEAALKENKADEVESLEMTEEEMQRIREEADDGW